MDSKFQKLFNSHLDEIKQSLQNKSYELVKEGFIGSGGFAVVYKVREIITRDIYAAKVIFRGDGMDVVESRRLEEQVISEIEIMEKYGSMPYMMPLTCYDIRKSFILIVMEYCPNGSLESYINDSRKLDENQLKVVIQQILIGINNLHKNGKIHRDIKPENILVDRHGEIRIADLGLAYDTSGKSKLSMSSTAGTDRYLSPEVYNHDCGQSVKSDIWAIGILLLELIFGKKKFQNTDLVSLNSRKVRKIFQGSSDTSSMVDLTDFASKCLDRQSDSRFDAPQLLNHRWLSDAKQVPAFLNDAIIIVDGSSVLISGNHQLSNYDGHFSADHNIRSDQKSNGPNNSNNNQKNIPHKNADKHENQPTQKIKTAGKTKIVKQKPKKSSGLPNKMTNISDDIDHKNNAINLNISNNQVNNIRDDSNSVSDCSIGQNDRSSGGPTTQPTPFPPPPQVKRQPIPDDLFGQDVKNATNDMNNGGFTFDNPFFSALNNNTNNNNSSNNMKTNLNQAFKSSFRNSRSSDRSSGHSQSRSLSNSRGRNMRSDSESGSESESDSVGPDRSCQNNTISQEYGEKHRQNEIDNNIKFDDTENTISRPNGLVLTEQVPSDAIYMDDVLQRITQKFGFLDDLKESNLGKFDLLLKHGHSEQLRRESDIVKVVKQCVKGDNCIQFIGYDLYSYTTGFWDAFSTSLKFVPQLLRLWFENSNLTEYAFTSISLSLSSLTNLKELEFGQNRITDKSIYAFSRNVTHLRNLEFLDLRENDITSTGCKYLSDAFKYLTSLKTLDLSRNKCGEAGMNYLSSNMKNLSRMEILIFDSTQIGDGGLNSLSSNFMFMKDLLAISVIDNNITDRGMDQLIFNTRQISQIKILNLSKNRVDDSSISQIYDRIDNFRNLEKLAVDFNILTDQSIDYICKCLHFTPKIVTLSLGGNNITDNGVIKLAQNLDHVPLLRNLKLNDSGLSDTCMDSLSFNLPSVPKLEKLHLHNNKFSDKGITNLAKAIPSLSCLKEINLQGNVMHDEGFTELFKQLVKISTIDVVNLMDNYITEASQSIVDSDRRHKKWKFFSVDSRFIPETIQINTRMTNQEQINTSLRDTISQTDGLDTSPQPQHSNCCLIL